MSDEIEVFLNKVDAFAQGLSGTEQAMLAYLVSDTTEEDEVSGFSFEAWPAKIQDIAPLKTNELKRFDVFLSSGHTSGNVNNFYEPGDLNA